MNPHILYVFVHCRTNCISHNQLPTPSMRTVLNACVATYDRINHSELVVSIVNKLLTVSQLVAMAMFAVITK